MILGSACIAIESAAPTRLCAGRLRRPFIGGMIVTCRVRSQRIHPISYNLHRRPGPSVERLHRHGLRRLHSANRSDWKSSWKRSLQAAIGVRGAASAKAARWRGARGAAPARGTGAASTGRTARQIAIEHAVGERCGEQRQAAAVMRRVLPSLHAQHAAWAERAVPKQQKAGASHERDGKNANPSRERPRQEGTHRRVRAAAAQRQGRGVTKEEDALATGDSADDGRGGSLDVTDFRWIRRVGQGGSFLPCERRPIRAWFAQSRGRRGQSPPARCRSGAAIRFSLLSAGH
jgi:hypothetical protein